MKNVRIAEQESILKLSLLLENLRDRQGMYLPNCTYNNLISFYSGYLLCYRDLCLIDIELEFKTWLEKELKTQFALAWPYYILRIIAKNDEVEAEFAFFTYWSMFLNDFGRV